MTDRANQIKYMVKQTGIAEDLVALIHKLSSILKGLEEGPDRDHFKAVESVADSFNGEVVEEPFSGEKTDNLSVSYRVEARGKAAWENVSALTKFGWSGADRDSPENKMDGDEGKVMAKGRLNKDGAKEAVDEAVDLPGKPIIVVFNEQTRKRVAAYNEPKKKKTQRDYPF